MLTSALLTAFLLFFAVATQAAAQSDIFRRNAGYASVVHDEPASTTTHLLADIPGRAITFIATSQHGPVWVHFSGNACLVNDHLVGQTLELSYLLVRRWERTIDPHSVEVVDDEVAEGYLRVFVEGGTMSCYPITAQRIDLPPSWKVSYLMRWAIFGTSSVHVGAVISGDALQAVSLR